MRLQIKDNNANVIATVEVDASDAWGENLYFEREDGSDFSIWFHADTAVLGAYSEEYEEWVQRENIDLTAINR